ncbi:MAG: glycosyltransferase family 4 protein [Chloroflexota bacterium]
MKIAHLTATFLPYHSGTGVVCYQNAMGLAKLGHDVTVVTAAHPPGEYEYPPEINVIRLPVRFRVGNAPLLPGLIGLKGYDLLHIHYPFVFGQEITFLKSLGKTRYVVTYHQDLIFDGFMGRLVNLHHTMLGRQILKRAERLLVTSVDYARSARTAGIVRNMPEKVVEIPNGVDIERFNPVIDPQPLRDQYGLQPEDKVILFVGGLDTPHYFKGINVLLQSIASIDDPSLKVVIVGDGDLRPKYTRQAQTLGLADRVIFAGRVSDEMLPMHYALCDVFILASTTMGEAFGIVLIEAMATGKPVIASNLPGVRSVVSDGVDGYLSEPNNSAHLAECIRRMFDQSDEARQQMGQAGRTKVEAKYAWPQIVKKLEATYEQVLAERSGAATDSAAQ